MWCPFHAVNLLKSWYRKSGISVRFLTRRLSRSPIFSVPGCRPTCFRLVDRSWSVPICKGLCKALKIVKLTYHLHGLQFYSQKYRESICTWKVKLWPGDEGFFSGRVLKSRRTINGWRDWEKCGPDLWSMFRWWCSFKIIIPLIYFKCGRKEAYLHGLIMNFKCMMKKIEKVLEYGRLKWLRLRTMWIGPQP